MKKLLALVITLLPLVASAQDITNHAVPIGGGPGFVGWKEALPCTSGVLSWASSTVDPTCSGTPTLSSITFGSVFTATPNYTGSNTQNMIQGVLGTSGAPNTVVDAPFIFQKWSTGVGGSINSNPTAYFAAWKTGNTSNQRVQAIYAEAVDQGGWNGMGLQSFVEGIRSQATVTGTNGSAYGLICAAGDAVSVTYSYLIGCEANTFNNSGVDSPIAASFNTGHFIAGFLATNNGTNKSDAGFIVNPFSTPVYRTGFLVAENSVDDTAFASRAATVIGLDLSLGSQSNSAILIPNNTAIRAKNGAGSQNLNIISVNSSNELVLNADTSHILVSKSFTSGVSALQVTNTQTTPNAGDTSDGLASFVYTLSAASATNELIARVLKLTATNSLTGGGALTNARIFNLVSVSSASTTTTNMDGIYIEQAGAAGTVTTGAAIRIASWLGTTKYGIADDSGGNWYNATGGLSLGAVASPGSGNLTATGTVRANTAFNANGTNGQSVTTTVRAAGGVADCTLIFTFGIKTGGTC